jgi:hypothetical protein
MNVKTTEMRMFDGSYNRVAAFARDWKAARQQEHAGNKEVGRNETIGDSPTESRQPGAQLATN